MKKLLLLLLFIIITSLGYAQTFSHDVVTKGLKNKTSLNYKLNPSSLNDVTIPLTLSTPALQLTFTQVEKVNGTWKLTTPLYIGYSYIYSYANGVIHQDSSITVENHFFFGGGVNFGVRPNDAGVLVGSVPAGAIVGFSKYGLFGGVDVISGKPLIAVSINLLNFPVLQSLTKFNLK